MVGIVIPTMNRSEFLIRQLAYYADLGCKHTIYIGDSSADRHVKRIQEAIRILESRVRIVYVQLSGASDYQAISELLQRVQEPYAALVGDDDFLIPASLEKCARFLDAHPDYEAAHGVAILFVTGSACEYGEFLGSKGYPQRPVEHTSAHLRLVDLLHMYWPVSFSVQRVETYRVAADLVSRLPDKAFRELLTGCFSIIRGKAKELDCLYLVRQAHDQRYLLPDMYDWVTSPDWLPSYQIFRDCLAEELARQDGICMDEAEEVVKQAFWSYLAKGMMTRWQSRYAQNGSGLYSELRGLARRIPGLRSTWHKVRSFLPGEDNQMSLQALLRPSSPYHADFMPIYRAVVSPPKELTT